jgi:hypothetical protein
MIRGVGSHSGSIIVKAAVVGMSIRLMGVGYPCAIWRTPIDDKRRKGPLALIPKVTFASAIYAYSLRTWTSLPLLGMSILAELLPAIVAKIIPPGIIPERVDARLSLVLVIPGGGLRRINRCILRHLLSCTWTARKTGRR